MVKLKNRIKNLYTQFIKYFERLEVKEDDGWSM